jgi:hypothetical protein
MRGIREPLPVSMVRWPAPQELGKGNAGVRLAHSNRQSHELIFGRARMKCAGPASIIDCEGDKARAYPRLIIPALIVIVLDVVRNGAESSTRSAAMSVSFSLSKSPLQKRACAFRMTPKPLRCAKELPSAASQNTVRLCPQCLKPRCQSHDFRPRKQRGMCGWRAFPGTALADRRS